jgi:hypothetical protein
MKAKLIRSENSYILKDGLNHVLGIDDKKLKDRLECPYLLSKQNCEEEFAKAMGIVDVDKWVKEKVDNRFNETDGYHKVVYVEGLVEGFNKAMELNKDKVFTLEQMSVAYNTNRSGTLFEQLINSFGGQPTEIEVEIVTTTRMENGKSGIDTPTIKPKLDSEGQLILKKI